MRYSCAIREMSSDGELSACEGGQTMPIDSSNRIASQFLMDSHLWGLIRVFIAHGSSGEVEPISRYGWCGRGTPSWRVGDELWRKVADARRAFPRVFSWVEASGEGRCTPLSTAPHASWMIARMLPSVSLNHAAFAPPAMITPLGLFSPGMS